MPFDITCKCDLCGLDDFCVDRPNPGWVILSSRVFSDWNDAAKVAAVCPDCAGAVAKLAGGRRRTAVVWGTADCPRCASEIGRLRAEGYEVEVRDAEAIADDPLRDDVQAQLVMQNGGLPVVMADGTFATPTSVAKAFH